MSKFDYMEFYGGSEGTQFVVHANKYTKEKALELFVSEYDYLFDANGANSLRKPTINDIYDARCRFYIRAPDSCIEFEGEPCYSFCGNTRGSFPVYVIDLASLEGY